MPVGVLADNDTLFSRFQNGLLNYIKIFTTDSFYSLVGGDCNSNNPFAFHYESDRHYISRFVRVYRKQVASIPQALYNEYAMEGLLDNEHNLGDS